MSGVLKHLLIILLFDYLDKGTLNQRNGIRNTYNDISYNFI